MIGPSFQLPQAPLAQRWSEAVGDSVDTTRQDYREWWDVFGDRVLSRLVETAYQQNLTLQMAGVRVLEARAQLGLAIGELYPQEQQISGEVSYNRIPVSIPYNIINSNYWQGLVGAQAAWEIDLWGKIRREVQSADYAFLASVADYDDVLVTLTADVASAYVQLRTLEKRLAIARENVERQKFAVRIADSRFRGGVVSKLDVYQAENVLGATEAAIPALTIELEETKNGLAVLLGIPPDQIEAHLTVSADIPEAPPQVAVGIPAELLRRRPDIRAAELDAAAQCSQIGVAKADLLPAFTLLGNVGTLATDVGRGDLGDLFSAKSLSYSAGPAVQWNILNYGQITNNVRIQDARFQELLASYQNTVLAAQEEVENGITVFSQSRIQADRLAYSAKAAAGAVRIAMNQYKEGTADFTTVLTAEENLYTAQDNLAVARGNIPLGLIATYRALGGGWQIREGNDFVPAATREEMAERTNWGEWLSPELLSPETPGLPGPEDAGSVVRPPEW